MMYREKKTIEASSFLLSKLSGEMPYIKLIKLLYLADREFVKLKGRTISGDQHFSLPYGPILSKTLDAIKSQDPEWSEHIGVDLESKVVWLTTPVDPEELSKSEIQVLEVIVNQFGQMSWPDLVEYTHSLPEWKEPGGKQKRQQISISDIARAVGHSEERVQEIVASEQDSKAVNRFLNQFREPA
jgi:uncharacterized phage-associated protein